MSKRTIRNPTITDNARATMSLSMTCSDWDKVGAALAGIKDKACQSLADEILRGLIKVGYYQIEEAA